MKKSIKFQILDYINPMIVFYICIVALMMVLVVPSFTTASYSQESVIDPDGGETFIRPDTGDVDHEIIYSFGGFEMATCIFLFILGLCSFKERFYFFVQNGKSRKTLFTGFVVSAVAVSAAMSLIDSIISVASEFVINNVGEMLPENVSVDYSTLYESVYCPWLGNTSSWLIALNSFFWCMFLYSSMMFAGYMITCLYYRLDKLGKTILSVSVPVGVLFVLPEVDSLVGGAISTFMNKALKFVVGLRCPMDFGFASYVFVGFAALGIILTASITWLIIRRAQIKE